MNKEDRYRPYTNRQAVYHRKLVGLEELGPEHHHRQQPTQQETR